MLDNRDAISRLESMKAAVEESWNQALRPGYDANALLLRSQAIQEGIYHNRSQNPLIFDWIANRLRPKNEALQSKSTKQYVADFKAAHPHLYP
ncbi:S-4TM family putative pore-forming effector [Massilia brevitalea]|uniref:S-4TM family putative pore-forming effector n=1 Tax=Massilia brevitalea TaxID=442526 RepID=UPI00351D5740